jgi:NitT/TauT family transport system substrate-binding protein
MVMKFIQSLLFLLLVSSVPPALAQGGPDRVSFIPQWLPQSQFAGYYVAYEKGFYRLQNLEVTILKGGPDSTPSELLKEGRADFATMFLATGIARRSQGVRLVNLAQIVQRSALMLVAKKDSGIKAPSDIQGKRVGLWGEDFQGQPRAFFQKYGLTVQVIPQGATLNLFLRGGLDVASAMWYNEYHLILNAGLDPEELTTFFFADHGMNFPEDGIYCLEETFRNHPERCARFVKASLEGWQYALAHPQEALDIVMGYAQAANYATNRVHQQWMLSRMRDIIYPRGFNLPLGSLEAAAYEQVAQVLKSHGLIKEIPRFADFYHHCGAAHEK